MSPNRQKYQEFATLLEQLRSFVRQSQQDVSGLRQRATMVQQFFQQHIVPLADEETPTPDSSRQQSYRTEMSKQLRLLEIDVMFFQGARQQSTAQARLDAISDRLTNLIQYCDAILQQKSQ